MKMRNRDEPTRAHMTECLHQPKHPFLRVLAALVPIRWPQGLAKLSLNMSEIERKTSKWKRSAFRPFLKLNSMFSSSFWKIKHGGLSATKKKQMRIHAVCFISLVFFLFISSGFLFFAVFLTQGMESWVHAKQITFALCCTPPPT